jgi:hypothetical protein
VFSAIDFPTPRYLITVSDQNTIKVDSFFVTEDVINHQYITNNFGSKDLFTEKKSTIFSNKFKLKVKLKDSTIIYSEPILISNKYIQYELIVKNNKVEITKLYGDYILHIAKSILLLVIASFMFKVMIYLFKFEIKNKTTYSLKYTFLNLIYCILFLLLGKIFFNTLSIFITFISIILICFTENWFHKHDKNVITKDVTGTVLLVNGLFFTVVMFIFLFIGLLYDLTYRF